MANVYPGGSGRNPSGIGGTAENSAANSLGTASNSGLGASGSTIESESTGSAGLGSSPGGATGRSSTQAAGARIVGGDSNTSGPGPEVMASDTLEGDEVVNSSEETLGEVKHIMIDVPSGRVAYAVVSCGGILGMGDRLQAVPWSALTLDADNKRFILNVDKETFKNAPGFDKDHWPSMADRSWASEVHRYYGLSDQWSSSSTDTRSGSRF